MLFRLLLEREREREREREGDRCYADNDNVFSSIKHVCW